MMMNKITHGRDYDRDKNLTYRPQDEAADNASDVNEILDLDIVSAIKNNHALLRKYIQVLVKSENSLGEKQQALLDIVNYWTAHSSAEENTLYDETQSQLTSDALEEHAIIQIMIDELESLSFRITWNRLIEVKARALAGVIDHSILDEQDTYFKWIKQLIPPRDLLLLGHEYQRQFEAALIRNKASLKPSHFNQEL